MGEGRSGLQIWLQVWLQKWQARQAHLQAEERRRREALAAHALRRRYKLGAEESNLEERIRQLTDELWEQRNEPQPNYQDALRQKIHEGRQKQAYVELLKEVQREFAHQGRSPLWQPLFSIERRYLEPFLSFLQSLALLEILSLVGNIGLIIAVVSYVATEKQRRSQAAIQAWNVVVSATEQTGSGGRRRSLEFLNATPGTPGTRRVPWFWLRWWPESLAELEAPGAYLPELNLPRADLAGANFQDANLPRATLHDADLTGANLQNADLQNATLHNARFNKADLQGANLQGTSLQGANLQAASLQGANLQNANLQGASLYLANLQDAELDSAILQGASLDLANLQNADLDSTFFQGASLERANLQDTSSRGANFQGAVLHHANLQNANLLGANLRDTELYFANLQNANLERTDLEGALFCDTLMPDGTDNDRNCETLGYAPAGPNGR